MTYNPEEDCLVICACETGYYTEIYFVELENLTFKKMVDLSSVDSEAWPTKEHGVNGIAYNQSRREYVVITDGNHYIRILDKDFNVVLKYDTKWLTNPLGVPTAITSQGIYCDDNYIYCLLYDSANKTAENTDTTQIHGISIFDWNGNRVKEIQFSVLPSDLPETELGRIEADTKVLKNEPENITFVNGKFYIGVNVGKAVNSDNGYQAQLLCTLEISN